MKKLLFSSFLLLLLGHQAKKSRYLVVLLTNMYQKVQ